MVVDDEKRLVSLVESYLSQEGYRVVSAYNGKEALNVARREKPDLIVLDVIGFAWLRFNFATQVLDVRINRAFIPLVANALNNIQ